MESVMENIMELVESIMELEIIWYYCHPYSKDWKRLDEFIWVIQFLLILFSCGGFQFIKDRKLGLKRVGLKLGFGFGSIWYKMNPSSCSHTTCTILQLGNHSTEVLIHLLLKIYRRLKHLINELYLWNHWLKIKYTNIHIHLDA